MYVYICIYIHIYIVLLYIYIYIDTVRSTCGFLVCIYIHLYTRLSTRIYKSFITVYIDLHVNIQHIYL